ncbi:MAG: UMP kinase [bacterium]|nr:UMP kinase [bacterium]
MLSPTIISLGGSLVAPDAIDLSFVRSFKALIEAEIKNGKQFVIIVGGGKAARRYQEAAKELGVDGKEELDWVGIYATRLNAELVRVAFGAHAHGEIIIDPSALKGVTARITIGAGWKPGWSTDFDAVEMAHIAGAKKIVNLSNIDFVFDKDPKQFPDAKKIEHIGWAEFRKDVLPAEWTPGVNVPFDPIAAKRAEELGLEVAIMNGKNLENLKDYLEGKKFIGTVIN